MSLFVKIVMYSVKIYISYFAVSPKGINIDSECDFSKLNFFQKSKLRWRTPLQATGYVRASAVVYCIFN